MASKGIVIGCAAYLSDGIPDLRYAEHDAHAIHARLIDPDIGGFEPAKTNLLISPIYVLASRQLEALLKGAAPDDSVVVYFAGHGLRDDRGQMYLAVTDTDPELLRATSISARFVRDLLDDCRSRKVCVILDCCFSGAFGEGQRSVLNAGDVKAGLGTLEAQGTIILTSSQASQQSRESEQHAHGTFTHYLLQGLDGAADTDDNGLITPVELYQFVSARMEREAGGSQRPMLLGSMSGGSFPIARSSLKRQEALASLESEVESLVERREHGAALRRIHLFTPITVKEEERLRALSERLRSDMVRLLREFRRKLYAEGGEGRLSGKVLHQADKILSSHGTYLFDGPGRTAKDHHEQLLWNHFLNRMSAEAMQDLWSKDTPDSTDLALSLARAGVVGSHGTTSHAPASFDAQPSSPVEPLATPPVSSAPVPATAAESAVESPGQAPGFRRTAVATVLCLTVLAIVLWMYLPRPRSAAAAPDANRRTDPPTLGVDASTVRPYNPRDIRLGVLLTKTGWTNANVKPTFDDLTSQLTSRMQPHYRLTNDVQTYTNFQDVIQALRAGEVDIVGELAAWEIYQANLQTKASPFVSPRYYGHDTYSATVFMSSNSPWLVRVGTAIAPDSTWEKVLERLDSGDKIAVSRDDESTSGYWYPRYMVLDGFVRSKRQRRFEDVAERLPKEQILPSVACGAGRIIAGIIADYKFESAKKQKCGDDVILVSVHSESIKNGAFVVRQALADDPTLMKQLRDEWPRAVAKLNPHGLELETRWRAVDLQYYEDTKHVFEIPDPVMNRRAP